MNQELHDKAWNLLKDKGLSMGEMIMVRSHFASMSENEYPFIRRKHEKDNTFYFSTHERISNIQFQTENEVILANSIYENVKDNFNPNEFIQQFKFTLRILGVQSVWVS